MNRAAGSTLAAAHVAPDSGRAAPAPGRPGLAGGCRIGMPQLTVNGLSERWLYAECGDRHWRLLAHAAVQALARDLGSAKLLKQRAACRNLTTAQQQILLCDGFVQTLLHFAPGFPGSTVSVLHSSTGGLLSRRTTFNVHYESREGRGNLEALLQREANTWRIAALIPHP